MHGSILATLILASPLSWPTLWPELNVWPTLAIAQPTAAVEITVAANVVAVPDAATRTKATLWQPTLPGKSCCPGGCAMKPADDSGKYAAPGSSDEARPWPLSPTGYAWFKSGDQENYGVFLVSADWCAACPAMKATLASLPEAGHVEVVDYDRQPDAAKRLLDGQQALLPQLVTYSRRGGKTIVRRLVGSQTAEKIKAFLHR